MLSRDADSRIALRFIRATYLKADLRAECGENVRPRRRFPDCAALHPGYRLNHFPKPPVGRDLARRVGLKADLHFEQAMFRQL